MKEVRTILFVTGTRADYGKLEPLAIAARNAGFDVSFFVTGMHLLPFYGLTKVEVHRLADISVVEFLNQREGDPQDTIFAKTVVGFSDYLQVAPKDLVVVHGDRVEAMAAAFVCATNYVRCAHIEGGEVSGTIDEIFRHCNTKLASCHLVSSEKAKLRVSSMGESEENIFVIGSPELDTHGGPSGVSFKEVQDRYDIPFSEYGIVILHPVTSEQGQLKKQAAVLFDSLLESGRKFVVIKPNNDPGSDEIVEVIGSLPDQVFRVLPSLRFRHFSELLKNASVLVGNSSTGIREAPFIGLPSLDLGTRQRNRGSAESVKHYSGFTKAKIKEFLQVEWGKKYPTEMEFGSGCASDNFIRILRSEKFWDTPLQKYFCE